MAGPIVNGEPWVENGAACLDVMYESTYTSRRDGASIGDPDEYEILPQHVHVIARLPLGLRVDPETGEPTEPTTRLVLMAARDNPREKVLTDVVEYPGAPVGELKGEALGRALRLQAQRIYDSQAG